MQSSRRDHAGGFAAGFPGRGARSNDDVIGKIGRGFVVLLGVAKDDTEKDAAYIADKTLAMRVFADAEGKMNLALRQVGGELLVISQFTLLADTESGRRPSFIRAAPPEEAKRLYELFLSLVRNDGVKVETGEFGAIDGGIADQRGAGDDHAR